MANSKTGLSYYNIDTDRYQDIRIKRLKKEFHCAGIAVYDYILCEIYRVRGCFLEWDESTAFDVAEYFGLKESLVNEIINYCCAVGLFDKELLTNERVLTSKAIQSRYIEMCNRAKRKEVIIPKEYLIVREECKIITEESLNTREVCDKEKKSKENILSPPAGEKVEFPAEDVFDKPLTKCLSILESDTAWREVFCMNNHIPQTLFTEYLRIFFSELQDRGDIAKTVKDAKFHFSNWFKTNKKPRDGTTDRKIDKQEKTRRFIAEITSGIGQDNRTDEEVLGFLQIGGNV